MPTRSHPKPSTRPLKGRDRDRRLGQGHAGPDESALRLTIGRDGVGLELGAPVSLGFLRVSELVAAFRGVRFPIDVSGGVSKFRNRRGYLQRLALEIEARALERSVAPRLRGLIGDGTPSVWIRVAPGLASVCISEERDADLAQEGPGPALAFDVHAMADEDVVLVVANARGTLLPAPAIAVAIAAVQAVVGVGAARAGSMFVWRRPAAAVSRVVLSDLGARAPATQGIRWSALAAQQTTWIAIASIDAAPVAPLDEALRAREIAELLGSADDLLVAGRLDDARSILLGVAERAPRHPEILRRVAEIDARVPGREEAALATLADMAHAPRTEVRTTATELLRGSLLARVGRTDAAMAALERAAETETAVLASRSLEFGAALSADDELSTRWLGRALALFPRSTSARWARARAYLRLGRLDDAMADLEHLEALAADGPSKHRVWMMGGAAWRAAGLHAEARRIYERALVQVPDEPAAIAGLGTALLAQGSAARGVALLARASALAEASGRPIAGLALDLARGFAESLDDLPTAIAHVSAVSVGSPDAPVARGLEGRWRARIGDVVPLLVEAARWELAERHDPRSAQRLVLAAMRLAPHDDDVRVLSRKLGSLILESRDGPVASVAIAPVWPSLSQDEPHRALRVEDLTRRVQSDPRDAGAAEELAALLESLDRGHEVLALLSARWEDATPDERGSLGPRFAGTLERLAAGAARDGRPADSTLFQEAIGILGLRGG